MPVVIWSLPNEFDTCFEGLAANPTDSFLVCVLTAGDVDSISFLDKDKRDACNGDLLVSVNVAIFENVL